MLIGAKSGDFKRIIDLTHLMDGRFKVHAYRAEWHFDPDPPPPVWCSIYGPLSEHTTQATSCIRMWY